MNKKTFEDQQEQAASKQNSFLSGYFFPDNGQLKP
jgi:hypothetical protein